MKQLSFALLIFALSSTFNVFAQSPAKDQGLLEQALTLRDQGKYDQAFDLFSLMRMQYPDSSLLSRAVYDSALCLLYDNRPLDAAFQFQQVISHYPSSVEAGHALKMNAILYRLYLAQPADRKVYAPDPAFSAYIADLDDPSGLSIDNNGRIYLSDKGKKSVYTFDASGKMVGNTAAVSPYSVSVANDGRVLVANDSTVLALGGDHLSFPRIDASSGQRKGFLEEIRSAAVNGNGQYFLVSNKEKGLAVYDSNKTPLLRPSIGKLEEFSKVAINSRGQIHVMDKRGELIRIYGPDGKALFTIQRTGKELNYGKLEDFAVDPANHIYALTDNPRGVLIFSPAGKFLKFLASDKKGALIFEDARVITVGPTGSIYVVDKDTKRIIKLG